MGDEAVNDGGKKVAIVAEHISAGTLTRQDYADANAWMHTEAHKDTALLSNVLGQAKTQVAADGFRIIDLHAIVPLVDRLEEEGKLRKAPKPDPNSFCFENKLDDGITCVDRVKNQIIIQPIYPPG